MNTNPRLEPCLLTYQGCSLVRQIRLATRHRRIVAAHYQCRPGARGALLSTCHSNMDVIVQADRHHHGIEEMVAVGPPTDYTQIQIDFGWGEALHGPHTLALVTQVDRLSPGVYLRIDEGLLDGTRIWG